MIGETHVGTDGTMAHT